MGPIGALIAKNPDMTSWHELLHDLHQLTPFLHRVSGSYEMIPNAAKHYAMHENMTLGANGVDSVRWLQKIPR